MRVDSTRRRVIAVAGGTLTVGIAGCTGAEEEPEDDDEYVDPEEDEGEPDEEYITLFEQTTEETGVTTDASIDGETFLVEYTTEAEDEEELGEEIGAIAGAYTGIVEEGYEGDQMEVIILNADGEQTGEFYVEHEWAEEYINDEIDQDEFILLILETLEGEEDEEEDEEEDLPDEDEVEQRPEGEDYLRFGDLEITEYELVVDEGEFRDEIYVEGLVENHSDEPFSLVTVSVRVYNEEGHHLDRYITTTSDLGGGRTWEFDVMILEDADEVDDWDIAVTGHR